MNKKLFIFFILVFIFPVFNIAVGQAAPQVGQGMNEPTNTPMSDTPLGSSTEPPYPPEASQQSQWTKMPKAAPKIDKPTSKRADNSKEKVGEEVEYVDPEGLKVGDKVPDVQGVGLNGKKVKISQINPNGYVVVIFYSGAWSESDKAQLRSFESQRTAIEALNAKIVAVSVDKIEYIKQIVADNQLNFDILNDVDAEISEAFNVADHIEDGGMAKYREEGIDIEEYSGKKHHIIAARHVFVIGQEKVIFTTGNEEGPQSLDTTPQQVVDILRTSSPVSKPTESAEPVEPAQKEEQAPPKQLY